jgi:glycine cleavage system H protein
MSVPEGLLYTKEHEWIRQEGDVVVVGITHHAQDQLGDVVYVELPEVGASIEEGDTFGTVESVKAVSDLYAPVTGEVVAINEVLEDAPEYVKTDAYGEGWMIKVKVSGETEGLMSPADYQALLG